MWELPGTVVHAKVVVADDVVSFGTVNHDAWALYRNSELMMIARSPEAAALVRERLFEPDIARSKRGEPPSRDARAPRELAVRQAHVLPVSARRFDRERVVRTLTFWLRPEFLLRVVNRFQKVAGFDRAIALASGALTAIIPLTIVTSACPTQLGGKGTAERIIERYDLTGGGAEAVKDIFSPPTGSSTSLGIVGFFFLLVAVLSFTRAVQRLFEQTWELEPAERAQHVQRAAVDRRAGGVRRRQRRPPRRAGAQPPRAHGDAARPPLSAVFLIWTGWVLSAKRIARQRARPVRASSERRCSRCIRSARRCTSRTSSARTPPATA